MNMERPVNRNRNSGTRGEFLPVRNIFKRERVSVGESCEPARHPRCAFSWPCAWPMAMAVPDDRRRAQSFAGGAIVIDCDYGLPCNSGPKMNQLMIAMMPAAQTMIVINGPPCNPSRTLSEGSAPHLEGLRQRRHDD
jgi:hypothetical protein